MNYERDHQQNPKDKDNPRRKGDALSLGKNELKSCPTLGYPDDGPGP
jgi:hypothetical protein